VPGAAPRARAERALTVARRRELAGRVAAVTGGARGIGLATARALAGAGMRVAIGDLDGDAAAAAADRLGGGAIGAPLDVTDAGAFERFLDRAEAELGPLDVLVNNAGVLHLGAFLDETPEQARRQLEVNFHGTATGMRLALPRMLARGGGHVVNVASSAGRLATPPGEATYAASKHAVVGLTESVRRELLGSGVDFSIVMPGIVTTEMAAGYKSTPATRAVGPEEVAEAIVEALERRRVDVWVPRSLGTVHRIQTLLPRGGRDLLFRVLRTDRVTWEADRGARAAYDARVGEVPVERP
jgi:NAD(P)-dependent dehydrogenase (short-subunit alcohol dehydrogenase family)